MFFTQHIVLIKNAIKTIFIPQFLNFI